MRHCPVDGKPFVPVGRQLHCSSACRQAAWRARHATGLTDGATTAAAALAAQAPRRRDVTVYTCPDCEQRYHAQQWCPDCNRPCTRDGVGGLCPSCQEPVTVDDLLDQHQARDTGSKIR